MTTKHSPTAFAKAMFKMVTLVGVAIGIGIWMASGPSTPVAADHPTTLASATLPVCKDWVDPRTGKLISEAYQGLEHPTCTDPPVPPPSAKQLEWSRQWAQHGCNAKDQSRMDDPFCQQNEEPAARVKAHHSRWFVVYPQTRQGDPLQEFYELPGQDADHACGVVEDGEGRTYLVTLGEKSFTAQTRHLAEVTVALACGRGTRP